MSNYELAVQVAKGVAFGKTATDFSIKGDVDQMIRGAFLEKIGVDTIDYKTYRRNQAVIFEIIEETISPIINDRLAETMGRFAEVRNVDFGDSIEFQVENPELFDVAVIADGTSDLRRQRLENGLVPVEMKTYGIKIYDEFLRFLAGRINWASLVSKIAKSFEKQIGENVYNAIYDSYNSLDAEFKFTGTYDEDELLTILARVEAAYGSAIILGTKPALARIKPEYIGGAGKDAYNALGYLANFHGYEAIALAQTLKSGTNDFALSNTDLLILPSSSEKIVKIVHEGDALIIDEQVSASMQLEHSFLKKTGIAIPITKRYGIVRFT